MVMAALALMSLCMMCGGFVTRKSLAVQILVRNEKKKLKPWKILLDSGHSMVTMPVYKPQVFGWCDGRVFQQQ
jgi:hypothetical protein